MKRFYQSCTHHGENKKLWTVLGRVSIPSQFYITAYFWSALLIRVLLRTAVMGNIVSFLQMTISCCLQLMFWVVKVEAWEPYHSQGEIQTSALESSVGSELLRFLFKQKYVFGKPYSGFYSLMFQHWTLFICYW